MLIKSGRYILKQHENNSKKTKSRPKCWETFKDVIDDGGNLLWEVKCCSLCYTCIIYKKHDDGKVTDFGTKNLLDHADKCGSCDKSGKRQSSLTVYMLAKCSKARQQLKI